MKKPNILLLLADQHRADCLGILGKYPVNTPNLDALAQRGMLFTDAYTPIPVCAPARQSLLSGLAPDYLGAYWNYDFFPTATLAPGATWVEALRNDGYHNAFLGRWHNSATHSPHDFGYADVIDGSEHALLLREKYGDIAYDGGWLGCPSPVKLEDSGSHYLAAKAGQLIESYAKSDAPWHIRVDFSDPHLPCRPSAPFSEMYRPRDMPAWDGFGDSFAGKPYIQKQQTLNWSIDGFTWDDFSPAVARYYGMISQLDDAVGNILDVLDRSGDAENTLVIYTSDHGDMCGSHGMLDKHYTLYDDVTRVPLIMAGPSVNIGRCGAFVSNCLDLSPTVRELAALPIAKTHGRSLSPLLSGDVPQDWRKTISSSANGQQFGLFTQRMIRDKRYKYVWNLTDTDEFYDTVSDPGEKTNLAHTPAFSEIISRMRKELHATLKAQEDKLALSGWLDGQLLHDKKL